MYPCVINNHLVDHHPDPRSCSSGNLAFDSALDRGRPTQDFGLRGQVRSVDIAGREQAAFDARAQGRAPDCGACSPGHATSSPGGNCRAQMGHTPGPGQDHSNCGCSCTHCGTCAAVPPPTVAAQPSAGWLGGFAPGPAVGPLWPIPSAIFIIRSCACNWLLRSVSDWRRNISRRRDGDPDREPLSGASSGPLSGASSGSRPSLGGPWVLRPASLRRFLGLGSHGPDAPA